MRARSPWFAALALAAAAPVVGAEPTLLNGWLRPAAAGAPGVDAYVDIRSDVALTLVGASTPVAKRVDLVAGAVTDGSYVTRVVLAIDVPANGELRFALKGNVLRFVAVQKSFGNADAVPLRLEFRDAEGRTVVATTPLQVRGLVAPRPAPVPGSNPAPVNPPAAPGPPR